MRKAATKPSGVNEGEFGSLGSTSPVHVAYTQRPRRSGGPRPRRSEPGAFLEVSHAEKREGWRRAACPRPFHVPLFFRVPSMNCR